MDNKFFISHSHQETEFLIAYYDKKNFQLTSLELCLCTLQALPSKMIPSFDHTWFFKNISPHKENLQQWKDRLYDLL